MQIKLFVKLKNSALCYRNKTIAADVIKGDILCSFCCEFTIQYSNQITH